MEIEKALLKEHSKKQCLRIVKHVGTDPQKFKELMKCFLSGEYRVAQRAAWPVSYCVEAYPALVKPYFKKLVEKLNDPSVPEAVPRNTIRLFQEIEIPKKWEGSVMDYCFKAISSPTAPIAVKAFSIRVLENLSKKYPEILQELKLIIEERWDQETPAFKSRGRKILRKIDRLLPVKFIH
jgi:hypothetical protein